MKLKEKVSIENFNYREFKIRIVEAEDQREAAFTHFIHNRKNGVSQFFRDGAIQHVRNLLEYKYPEEKFDNLVTEEALQYLIFEPDDIPFPPPKNPKFKFIDLFAGIGGFRIAMQNLGGKCVFTSEWDKYAKQTYKANFGEVPFGDITKIDNNLNSKSC